MIVLVVQWQFSKPKPKPKPRFFPVIPTETDRVLTIQNRYNTMQKIIKDFFMLTALQRQHCFWTFCTCSLYALPSGSIVPFILVLSAGWGEHTGGDWCSKGVQETSWSPEGERYTGDNDGCSVAQETSRPHASRPLSALRLLQHRYQVGTAFRHWGDRAAYLVVI